jgi:pyridoxine 5-phosphate synthase
MMPTTCPRSWRKIPPSSRGAAPRHEPALRLGVNIDHVATIRNARGGPHPDPVRAAHEAARAGADGITAHLREDRRHITDEDIDRLMAEIDLPLNLEMAATEEMLAIALAHSRTPPASSRRSARSGLPRADWSCWAAQPAGLFVDKLGAANIRVSLFIEPSEEQLRPPSGWAHR